MTSLTRRVAGGVTALEGAFAFYTLSQSTPVSCQSGGCPLPQVSWPIGDVVTGLAVVLLVTGALGLWGAAIAYPAGAFFSFLFLVLIGYAAYLDAGYSYLANLEDQELAGAALAAVALVVNLLGMRARRELSEQANPMNLPVFG